MPSTAPDSIETLLALGIAAELGESDIVTYAPSGTYPADAVRPLYFGPDEPANTPDERVLLTVRPAVPTRGRIGVVTAGISWRGPVDGDPLAGLNFVGLLFRRLHRLDHHAFGAVRVGTTRQTSAGTLGRDARRRPAASANYLFRLLHPSAND